MGYSCIMTVYQVAFVEQLSFTQVVVDQIVDCFFYVEIILNFFHERISELNQKTSDIKGIARIYVKSWFFIDFVSVFPFTLIIKEGVAAKLLRLFRMPKLLKLS